MLETDEEKSSKKQGEMTLAEVKDVAKLTKISSMDEIEDMLQCFHLLGFVFHYRSTDAIVYTKPHLLVKEISKVLVKQTPIDRVTVKQCGLLDDLKEFKRKAVISR